MKNLSEITRIELLDKVKQDTKARYDRRLSIDNYEIRYYPIDTELFYNNDILLFQFKVKDYRVSIEIDGINKRLGDQKVTYKNTRKLLMRSFDDSDIKINCSCPDFKYRYAYTATEDGFKEGEEENRPSLITNPDGKGGACKHLIKLLSNKRWLNNYISLINVLMKLKS